MYPRRCCDSDPRITFDHPVLQIDNVPNSRPYCSICVEMYDDVTDTIVIGDDNQKTAVASSNDDTPDLVDDEKVHRNQGTTKMKKTTTAITACCTKPKISSRIVGRSLKPVQGMFYNIPKYSKHFCRVCDALGQDTTIRNCGPGFILRKAMQSIPEDILDEEFVWN